MLSSFGQTLRLGTKSLLLHKLRSALAVLGILIGVTAVIWLVAMGEGVSRQAQEQIKELGATNVIVRSIKPAEGSKAGSSSTIEYGLLRDDYDRIKNNVPTVTAITKLREIRKTTRHRERTVDTRLVGCTPAYVAMNHLKLARGRFLSDHDDEQVK
ncbi:MAG: ABC transporter permease, partial [Planctomycetaceae bacterium]|nr:ABC transporter permease [Planctomycetaceae bacterium]